MYTQWLLIVSMYRKFVNFGLNESMDFIQNHFTGVRIYVDAREA